MKPWLSTSSLVAADRHHLRSLRLHLEPAGGFAERTGAVMERHWRSLLLPAARSRAPRDAHSSRPCESNSAQAPWRLRPSDASGQERIAWRSPISTEQPSRAVRRASTIGGPAGEVRHRRAGRAVERRPHALGQHVAGAVVERLRRASSRWRSIPVPELARGTGAARRRARGRGRRRSRWGRGGGRTSGRGPPRTPRRRHPGTPRPARRAAARPGSPSATSASPSRSSTRSPSRTTSSGGPIGGGRRSDTPRPRRRRAPRPARRCSRRWPTRAGR